MTIRFSLFLAFAAVLAMRSMRGGWSREQLRKDGFGVLMLTALIVAMTKVAGL